jgi:hypothetical protein
VASRGKVGAGDTASAAAAASAADNSGRQAQPQGHRRGSLRPRPDRNRVPLRRQESRRPGWTAAAWSAMSTKKSGDMQLKGSAADLARQGKPVPAEKLQPGDLVFFNTRNKPRSHVGIYIGDDRFVHAPNSRGKVRTESLKKGLVRGTLRRGPQLLRLTPPPGFQAVEHSSWAIPASCPDYREAGRRDKPLWVFHRNRGRGIVVADSAGVARRCIRLLHPRAMRGFQNPAGAIQPDFFMSDPKARTVSRGMSAREADPAHPLRHAGSP